MSVYHHFILIIRFAGMGNLLKVLTREIENYPHFFLDFESKSRRGEERETGERSSNLLSRFLSVSRFLLPMVKPEKILLLLLTFLFGSFPSSCPPASRDILLLQL